MSPRKKSGRKNQLASLPFAKLDSGIDPKVNHEGFTKVENAVFNRSGAIEKRSAIAKIGSDVTTDIGKASVLNFSGQPAIAGDKGIWTLDGSDLSTADFESYDATYGLFWDVDSVGFASPHKSSQESKFSFDSPVHMELDDVYVIAWVAEDHDEALSREFEIATYNKTTRRKIASTTINRGAGTDLTNMRVVKQGATAVVVYAQSFGHLYTITISAAGAIASPVEVTDTVDFDQVSHIDAVTFGEDDSHIFVCGVEKTTKDLLVVSIELGVSVATDTIVFTDCKSVGCFANGDSAVCLAVEDGATIHAYQFDTALTEELTTDNVAFTDSIVGIAGVTFDLVTPGMYATFTSHDANGAAVQAVELSVAADAFSFGAISVLCRQCIVHSKPWVGDDEKCFMWIHRTGPVTIETTQKSLLLTTLTGSSMSAVGQWHTGTSAIIMRSATNTFNTSFGHYVPCDTFISGEEISIAALRNVKAISFGVKEDWRHDNPSYNIHIVTASLAPPRVSYRGDSTVLVSSQSYEMDAIGLVELGFVEYPDFITAAGEGAASGTSLSAGDYSYKAVYRWRDMHGNLHTSAPSRAATFTNSASYDNTLITVSWPLLSRKVDDLVISLFRTEANGSLHYFLADIDSRDVTDGFVEIEDTEEDSSLGDELLYTETGVLENIPLSSSKISVMYQSRHLVVDQEDQVIRYSKKFINGEGVSHSDFLIINVPESGGAITALGVLDDKLLIFKKNKIFMTYGDGLNSVGAGQGYALPSEISGSIGCINDRSVVKVPAGLLFEGNGGVYSMNHSTEIDFIGEPIRYYYDSIGTTTQTAHIPSKNQVIFTTSNATAFSYNYKYDRWSTFTSYKAYGAIELDNVLMLLCEADNTTDSAIYYSTSASYTGVIMTLETGWMSFAGIMGEVMLRRFYLLGQNIGAHTLTVKAQFDFDPYWSLSETFDTTGIGQYFDISAYFGAGLSSAYANTGMMLEGGFSRQRCSSFRLQIVDSSSVTLAPSFTALSFQFAPSVGPKKFNSGRSF